MPFVRHRDAAAARSAALTLDGGAGQPVRALIEGNAGVAGDLVPAHVVAVGERDERFPEIAVSDGLVLRVLPAVLLPARVPPFAEAIHDVGAVAVHGHAAAARDRAKSLDHGAQLHALVGGGGLAAGDLTLSTAVDNDGAPPAGPGVARAGAVAVDDDGIHARRRERVRGSSRGNGRRTRSGSARFAAGAPAD